MKIQLGKLCLIYCCCSALQAVRKKPQSSKVKAKHKKMRRKAQAKESIMLIKCLGERQVTKVFMR